MSSMWPAVNMWMSSMWPAVNMWMPSMWPAVQYSYLLKSWQMVASYLILWDYDNDVPWGIAWWISICGEHFMGCLGHYKYAIELLEDVLNRMKLTSPYYTFFKKI